MHANLKVGCCRQPDLRTGSVRNQVSPTSTLVTLHPYTAGGAPRGACRKRVFGESTSTRRKYISRGSLKYLQALIKGRISNTIPNSTCLARQSPLPIKPGIIEKFTFRGCLPASCACGSFVPLVLETRLGVIRPLSTNYCGVVVV